MQFIDQIRDQYKSGSKSVLGVAPVAFGKTVVSSYIAKSAQDKGSRVIFTVHRDNLVHQTSATFKDFGIDHGFITANEKYDTRKTVHIASIQTLARRTGIILLPDLLVVDECHLAKAKTWQDVILWAKNNGSRILGNSGSPSRLDGKPLGDLFDSMVESVPMSWLIDQGFLSSYRYFAPTMPDMSGVKKSMGDFSDSDTVEVMDTPKITGDAVTHWLKHAKGMRTICFCVTIAHAEHTAQSFKQAGIAAAVVSAKTPANERKRMFIDLADGKLQVLCNVELVTTGFDLSAQAGRDVPVECVIMLRPTQSLALYIQMVGRALRRKPYPAVILDHAGNSSRHGLPDDERKWRCTRRETSAPMPTASERLRSGATMNSMALRASGIFVVWMDMWR
jgi:superfamily II DNA or RNA helicase